jgi:hypothetical protein
MSADEDADVQGLRVVRFFPTREHPCGKRAVSRPASQQSEGKDASCRASAKAATSCDQRRENGADKGIYGNDGNQRLHLAYCG